MKGVLLVFPSPFSVSKLSYLQSSVRNALDANNIKCREIFVDDSLIVADVDDAITAASIVADLFGVDKVAVANKSGNKFNDLVAAIVDVGKKIINAEDTFAVKVVAKNAEYVGRDVEFAATASLIGELSKLNVRVANENACNKLLYAHASHDSAYVCIFIDKGLNGLPSGSQNERMMCSLHNGISALSCLMAVKCGFTPQIVMLKTNGDDLKDNAKNLELIAKHLGTKKMKLDIVNADITRNGLQPLLIEKLSSMILVRFSATYKIRNVALPLSTAIFPAWFVSDTVSYVARTAVPWLPLMFMSDELYTNASALRLKDYHTAIESINKTNFDADEFAKLVKALDLQGMVESTIKSSKTLDLEVGPNFLHDIMDSATI